MWWLIGIAIIIAVILIKSCAPKSKETSEQQTNNNIDLMYKSDKILKEFLSNNEVAVTHFRLYAKIASALAKDCSESQVRKAKTIQALYEDQNRQFEDFFDKIIRESNLTQNKKKTKPEKISLPSLKNRDFYLFDFSRMKDIDPVLSSFTKKRIKEEQESIKSSLRHLYYDMNNVERLLFDKALVDVDELKLFHNIIDA